MAPLHNYELVIDNSQNPGAARLPGKWEKCHATHEINSYNTESRPVMRSD